MVRPFFGCRWCYGARTTVMPNEHDKFSSVFNKIKIIIMVIMMMIIINTRNIKKNKKQILFKTFYPKLSHNYRRGVRTPDRITHQLPGQIKEQSAAPGCARWQCGDDPLLHREWWQSRPAAGTWCPNKTQFNHPLQQISCTLLCLNVPAPMSWSCSAPCLDSQLQFHVPIYMQTY